MSLSSDDTTNIVQLYSRYSTALDTGDTVGFANCFVPDGLFNNGINVIEGQADQLPAAQSKGCGQIEEREVSAPERLGAIDRLEKRLHLRPGQRSRQPFSAINSRRIDLQM